MEAQTSNFGNDRQILTSNSKLMENTWFWRPAPRINAGMRLFCFPYAGGNSITIYRRWPALLPAEIELIAIQLPGRGNRIAEPPSRRLSDIIAPLSKAIAPLLDKPVSFFGYSISKLICFKLARLLRRQYGVEPTHLALAGRRAPQDPAERQITYNLPLSEFIAEIQKYNGLPSQSLKDEEMLTTREKRVDCSKARRDLNLKSTVALDEGIRLTLDWMKDVYGKR